MSLKSELFTYLSAVLHNRIYTDMAPKSATLPYITHQIISADHSHAMDGPIGRVTRRVQFDIYGATADSVDSQFEELRDQLDGLIGISLGNLQIEAIWLDNERDGYIDPTDSSQVAKHRRIVDFMIAHRTTIPGQSG